MALPDRAASRVRPHSKQLDSSSLDHALPTAQAYSPCRCPCAPLLLHGDGLRMILITWNVQWCRGMDNVVDPARIARVARNLADFDVLCLQEVAINFPGLPGSSGENQFARLSAALPGYTALYGCGVDMSDGKGGRSQFGNAIFTRLPVVQ